MFCFQLQQQRGHAPRARRSGAGLELQVQEVVAGVHLPLPESRHVHGFLQVGGNCPVAFQIVMSMAFSGWELFCSVLNSNI